MKARSYLTLLLLLLGVTAWGQTTYKLEQVTSVEAGSKYVFEQDGYVMNNTISSSALQTTNNYSATGLTGSESYVWTLESATGGFYMINCSLDSKQYLSNSVKKSTNLSFDSRSYSKSVWSFSFQDNTATIQNTLNENRFLGFTNETSHAYKAYAASNLSSYPHAIKVYKLVEDSGPTCTVSFDQPETVFAGTFNVTLTASDENAAIYYTTDGSTPTKASNLYEDGITLNATTTIKAVAVLGGVAGPVASATYQKNEPVTESWGDIFSHVSDVQNGDQIIIVNEDFQKVLDEDDATSSGNNRMADDFEFYGDRTIQMKENKKVLTLKNEGDGWILYTDETHCLYTSRSQNLLKNGVKDDIDPNLYTADISFDNEGNAIIKYFKDTDNERTIRLNKDNKPMIFSCYTGGQQPVQIYRNEKIAAVTLNETSTDNGTIISNAVKQGKVLSVNLYRQLTANMWNAICLPFDMDDAKMKALFGDGYKLRSFSGVKKEGGDVTLMFDEAEAIKAGKPYIVLPTKTVERDAVVVISNVTLTNADPKKVTFDGYTFQGIYAPKSFTKGDKSIRFIGSGNKFYYPNSTTPMRAFRAYFTLPTGTTEAKVGMSFDEDMGVATGIVAVDGGAVDGRIYSMSGQYVGTSTQGLPRGLYIRDGRKFVVK